MTYYEKLNAFFRANEYAPLPASVQLLYLHLLHINNFTGNTGKFRCTDSRLADLTRLSKKTIADARQILIRERLIAYVSVEGKPRIGGLYRILNDEPQQQPKPKDDYLSSNSVEVQKAWNSWNGVRLSGGVALELIGLEHLYGTEKLLAAIETAGKSNNRHNLSINFVKAILEGKTPNGKSAKPAGEAESWEQQRPDWLDY